MSAEEDRLRAALRACIDDLKEWGQLALSSDYSGPDDKGHLAADIARHEVQLSQGWSDPGDDDVYVSPLERLSSWLRERGFRKGRAMTHEETRQLEAEDAIKAFRKAVMAQAIRYVDHWQVGNGPATFAIAVANELTDGGWTIARITAGGEQG